jgi:LysM repeat protein
VSRRQLARIAAPAAFLAAVTIAVLLIRSGLQGGHGATPTTQTVAHVTTGRAAAPRSKKPTRPATTAATTTGAAVYYTVQSGDTYGSIAARYGTSVPALEALNPGVSSTALTVGQRIRVK